MFPLHFNAEVLDAKAVTLGQLIVQ